MHRSIISVITMTLISQFLFSQIEYHDFEYDGITRDYIVFLPQEYNSLTEFPVILNLHGYGSEAESQMTYSGMNSVADTAGFIAVYPNAVDNVWNSGISDIPIWLAPDVDDVGFISALIDMLDMQFSIDLNRIYSSGMSNGGFMSYKLACELSDRIAAIASVTGTISQETAENCDCQRTVPILQLHGTADPVVPYYGPVNGWYSAQQAVEYWVELNSCSDSQTTPIPNFDPTDGCTVVKYLFPDCDDSSEIVFFRINNGGHTWPGATVDINPSLYGNTNHDINANHEIWSFVSNYELNRTIGDLNQDGVLDVLDIVEIVDCILGDPAENCLYGDVNEDGIVDVIDVVQMVSLILGR